MKEAIVTDLNGRYIEPTLVADSVTGVFDRLERIEPDEPGTLSQPEQSHDDDQPQETETVLVGYTVAVPMPDGLYQPIFDVEGYRSAQEAYDAGHAEYVAALVRHDPESKDPKPEPPQPVDGSCYWRNGLTQEEIAELHEKYKPEPSPLEYLGKQLVECELEVLTLRKQNEATGAVMVDTELRILERMEANSNV